EGKVVPPAAPDGTGVDHGGPVSVRPNAPQVHAPAPEWLAVSHAALEVGAHMLRGVTLAGARYGQAIGTAPVTVSMGGITASPWAFGGAPDAPGDGWWPALLGPDLLDPTRDTL